MSDGLKKKIAVGGIEHETAGFLPRETSLEDFLKSKISALQNFSCNGQVFRPWHTRTCFPRIDFVSP